MLFLVSDVVQVSLSLPLVNVSYVLLTVWFVPAMGSAQTMAANKVIITIMEYAISAKIIVECVQVLPVVAFAWMDFITIIRLKSANLAW